MPQFSKISKGNYFSLCHKTDVDLFDMYCVYFLNEWTDHKTKKITIKQCICIFCFSHASNSSNTINYLLPYLYFNMEASVYNYKILAHTQQMLMIIHTYMCLPRFKLLKQT